MTAQLPMTGRRTPEWFQQAACRGITAVMYVDRGNRARRAREVCAGCPVAEPCRAWAIEHREENGVWGGTTPRERRQARRSTRPAARQPAQEAG